METAFSKRPLASTLREEPLDFPHAAPPAFLGRLWVAAAIRPTPPALPVTVAALRDSAPPSK